MVFVAAVGAAVEIAVGPFKYGLVYFLGGLAGVGLHYVFASRSGDTHVLVGASGCVSSCIGYYSSKFIKTRVSVWPNKTLSVATLATMWGFLQISGAFVRLGSPEASVAFWAHIGGFCCGLLLSLIAAPARKDSRKSDALLDAKHEHSPDALIKLAEQQLEKNPSDVHALRSLVEAHGKIGDRKREATALSKLAALTNGEEQANIVERLGELGSLDLIPIMQRQRWGHELGSTFQRQAEALLTSVIQDPSAGDRKPEAMLDLVEILMPSNPARAQQVLQQLQAEYANHPTLDIARQRKWLA